MLSKAIFVFMEKESSQRSAGANVLYVLYMSNLCICFPLSACLLQRQNVDYARVQEYSLRVLQWQPGNVKALYRAGVATLEMGDAQTAKQYLTKACREQPNGKKITITS